MKWNNRNSLFGSLASLLTVLNLHLKPLAVSVFHATINNVFCLSHTHKYVIVVHTFALFVLYTFLNSRFIISISDCV